MAYDGIITLVSSSNCSQLASQFRSNEIIAGITGISKIITFRFSPHAQSYNLYDVPPTLLHRIIGFLHTLALLSFNRGSSFFFSHFFFFLFNHATYSILIS